jgi:hypothetical protein
MSFVNPHGLCKLFQQGNCYRGSKCKLMHPDWMVQQQREQKQAQPQQEDEKRPSWYAAYQQQHAPPPAPAPAPAAERPGWLQDIVSAGDGPPSPPPASVIDSERWFYRDLQAELQGPFDRDQMRQWHEAGYFADDCSVGPSSSGEPPSQLWPMSTLWRDASDAFTDVEVRRRVEDRAGAASSSREVRSAREDGDDRPSRVRSPPRPPRDRKRQADRPGHRSDDRGGRRARR